MANVTDINSTNAPNGSQAEHLNDTTAAIINISLQVAIAFIGIIGNILVCVVILRKSKMNSVMNYYLLSLAVSDLGIISINFPIAITRVLGSEWLLGDFGCKYVFPTSEMFFGASIWSIKAIAIERYRNIVGKGSLHRERSTKPAKIIISFIWTASFVVASVPMMIVIEYNPENRSCDLGWPAGRGWHIAYFVMLSVVWYVIPLLVIIYTYIHISRTVQESLKFHQASMIQSSAQKGKSPRRKMQQNNKAKRILTPLVVLFAVTMFPISILRVGQFFWGHLISPSFGLVLFMAAIYGVVINSSVNPVIYYIVSRDFRQAFKDIFRTIRLKRKALSQLSQKTSSRSCNTPRHVSVPHNPIVELVSGV